LQVDDLRALAHKVNRKHLKSDVDHARRRGKQVVPFCLARGFHDQFVRSIQACLSILQAAGFCEPLAIDGYVRRSRGAGIEYPVRKSSIKCTTPLTRIVSLPTQSKPK
jgi:hypothetical protein